MVSHTLGGAQYRLRNRCMKIKKCFLYSSRMCTICWFHQMYVLVFCCSKVVSLTSFTKYIIIVNWKKLRINSGNHFKCVFFFDSSKSSILHFCWYKISSQTITYFNKSKFSKCCLHFLHERKQLLCSK